MDIYDDNGNSMITEGICCIEDNLYALNQQQTT